MNESEKRVFIRDLASAASTHARVADRAWIAVITVAVASIFQTPGKDVFLLFNFRVTDTTSFYTLSFGLLAVLLVAFSAAHAQQVRVIQLALTQVTSVPCGDELISSRELFDMFHEPSVVRVAPLAQILRGKFQFSTTVRDCPPCLRRATAAYYAVLKASASVIYFGLPAYALFIAYNNLQISGWRFCIASFAGALSGVAIMQVLIAEMIQMGRVTRILWEKPESANG
jgi:hypothetical protein